MVSSLVCALDLTVRWLQYMLLQEPVTVKLGERHVWKGSGCSQKLVTKVDTFIYIPILQTPSMNLLG